MIKLLLTSFHVLVSFFLILVVLLQQGKGADLSVFGGGGTQTAFGARGAATILHKMTVFGFVSFIATTILIGVFVHGRGGGSSVMEDLSTGAAVEAPAPDVDASAPASELETEGTAPAIGVGAESTSPDVEVQAEPVGGDPDAAGAADQGGTGSQ